MSKLDLLKGVVTNEKEQMSSYIFLRCPFLRNITRKMQTTKLDTTCCAEIARIKGILSGILTDI